jgi:ribosomal protein S3AE|tara:strand:- start:184 stop:897 length:714 start_codon:yes stop_codon:yes gene_type:complete
MAKTKVLKKEWYPILAPKIFHNAVLGETHVYEPQQMIGKGVTANLMNLTNDVKRQNINLNFEVFDVQNGKAFTKVIGYYMVQSSIKRMIRRNINKIGMSFLCKTSDNKHLQIKPLLITRSATTGSVATKIRRNAQDFVTRYVSSVSYDNLLNDMINHKLQISLKRTMSKIYPLRVCEIGAMKIIDLEKKEQIKSKAKFENQAKPAKQAEESKDAKKEEGKPKEAKETKPEKEPSQAA